MEDCHAARKATGAKCAALSISLPLTQFVSVNPCVLVPAKKRCSACHVYRINCIILTDFSCRRRCWHCIFLAVTTGEQGGRRAAAQTDCRCRSLPFGSLLAGLTSARMNFKWKTAGREIENAEQKKGKYFRNLHEYDSNMNTIRDVVDSLISILLGLQSTQSPSAI